MELKIRLKQASGAIITITGLIFIIASPILFRWLLFISERHFSSDHHILLITKIHIAFYYFLFAGSLVMFGIFLTGLMPEYIRSETRRLLLVDFACRYNPIVFRPYVFLCLSTTIGALFSVLYFIQPFFPSIGLLFSEDKLFENMTVVFHIISSIIILRAIFVLRINCNLASNYKWISYVYIILALIFIVFAMEEISWGQRLFGWETPYLISEINLQNETNLHNFDFFSPYYPFFYKLTSLIPLFSILFSIWLDYMNIHTLFSLLVFPHPNMIGLGLIIGLPVINHEILEILISLFAIFYSLRVLNCVNKKNLIMLANLTPRR